MARIDIKSSNTGGGGGGGNLQLLAGASMSATLTAVADTSNTTSPLKLSTTAVQVVSPLRITTSDASGFYLDAEDSATNNRFSIKRDPSSQLVTLDFASNPAGSTTAVGAIRTYVDGVNLSEAMTFREDGNVGIGTTTPNELLDVAKNQASPTRINITNTDAGGTSTLRFTNATGAAAALFENSSNQLTFQNNTNSGVLRFQTTNAGGSTLTAVTVTGDQNVGINTTSPTARLQVVGSGSTSATTSLLVQNSAGTAAMTIKDDLSTTFGSSINANYINMQFTGIYNSEYFSLASGVGSLGSSGLYVGSGGILPSAIIQANSTTQGFLPPRMTDAQRAAISSPAEGLLVYNTDNHAVAYRDGTNWGYLCGALQNVTGAGGTQNILFASGNIVNLTLNASTTLTFSGHVVGTYIIQVTQGGAGSNTLTYPASVKWSGGTAPTLTTTVGKTDILTFYHDGTNFFGTYSLNY